MNNKKVQNFDHFQKFFEKFWGPNSKFGFLQFFGHKKISTFWKFESSSWKTEGGVPILLKMTFFDLAPMTFDLSGFWKVVTQALVVSNNISLFRNPTTMGKGWKKPNTHIHMSFASNRIFRKKNAFFKKISEIHFWSDSKNFKRYVFRVPKSIDNSNLKVLARIIKSSKFWPFSKIFWKILRP